jgi:hypothetical protein
MTNRTITARRTTLTGVVAGATFTDGTATVDDATDAGKRAIEYAKRHGWAVSGSIAAAVDLAPADGEALIRWTDQELRDYLTNWKVQFPSGATREELLDAVRDAFETKAQGGSAANESAGHTSGSMPPEGAPPVSNPDKPDDAEKAELWVTPQVGNVLNDVAPTISVQPTGSSKVQGATATYTVTAAGTPTPTYQWQRQALGSGSYVDIDGATAASYTTPALTVAANHNDRYRVVVSNSDGSVTSNSYQQAVTAS